MIYGHGDDSYRYGDKVKINFSTNIYQKADLTGLKEYLMVHFDVVKRHPEPIPEQLEGLIAEKHGIPANMVMVTNGTEEAIYLIAQLYRGWASVIPQPTNNEFADACRLYGHLISYERADELELLPQDRIYWMCVPDNPTGNVLLKPLVMHFIRQNPRFLHVVDLSFADYTLQPMIKPHEMMDCYNVMMLYSLSAKYAIPGLRLGYITASPIIIDRLRQLRQPWTVGSLAIEAGKYLVAHDPQHLPDMRSYLAEAQRLHDKLSSIEGLLVMDTATNYMLINVDWVDTPTLKNWLVENYGILIRDASNFHGLDSHCFRVASQSAKENDMLIEALLNYRRSRRMT